MSETISFDTGLKTFDINGKCEVVFNPTDPAFVERIYNTFDALDKKQEAYKSEIEKAEERETFGIAQKRDKEMREMIDSAFGAPVCEAVFGSTNVYALADGLPVWVNLILAIMEKTGTSFAAEKSRTNPRLEKYTRKYHK